MARPRTRAPTTAILPETRLAAPVKRGAEGDAEAGLTDEVDLLPLFASQAAFSEAQVDRFAPGVPRQVSYLAWQSLADPGVGFAARVVVAVLPPFASQAAFSEAQVDRFAPGAPRQVSYLAWQLPVGSPVGFAPCVVVEVLFPFASQAAFSEAQVDRFAPGAPRQASYLA